MIPSKGHFPRAAGLFGRIARVSNRNAKTMKSNADIPSAESYRKMLLRNPAASAVGRPKARDTEA